MMPDLTRQDPSMSDSTCTYTCPICHLPMTPTEPDQAKLHAHMKDHLKRHGALVCQKGHTFTMVKYYWEVMGVGISGAHELRCPYCHKLFVEGDYSDRPQVIKCHSCKKSTTFLRLC